MPAIIVKRRWFITKKIIIILFSIFLLTSCQKKDEKDNIEETKIPTQKTVNDIIFDNIEYNYDGTYSNLSMTVHNNQDEPIVLGNFKINILDQDDNIIAQLEPHYGQEIGPNDEGELTVSIALDLSQAKDIEIALSDNE